MATSAYITIQHWQVPAQPWIKHDPRIGQLAQFETQHHFAPNQLQYAKIIIESADKNNIDFALLPAIELKESSGGKRHIQSLHNPFGWCSDRIGFKSISDGIDFISTAINGTPQWTLGCDGKTYFWNAYYIGDTRHKLTSWNGSAYADKAMKLIEEIHNESKTP